MVFVDCAEVLCHNHYRVIIVRVISGFRKLTRSENVNPLEPNHNGICSVVGRGVEGIDYIIKGIADEAKKLYAEQIIKNKFARAYYRID